MKKNWKKLIALGLGVMMLAGCGASNQSGQLRQQQKRHRKAVVPPQTFRRNRSI